MKKLITLLTVCLLLAASLPALAEAPALHTFAGIPWDTPKDAFITVATEQVGVPFDTYSADVFRELDPAFVIQSGYYAVLGLPLDDSQRISAYYSRTDALLSGAVEWTDPAGWSFQCISCVSDELPIGADVVTGKALPGELQLAQDVANNVIARYGTPNKAYVALSGWGYDYYLVPEEEVPCIIHDAALFADMNDTTSFRVILVIHNVLYTLDVSLPEYRNGRYEDGSYTIRIEYLSHPVKTSDFSDKTYGDQYEADLTEPFPLLNGEIPYIIIEP